MIRAFLLRHPDGLVLVDTGVGADNELIDELYSPSVRSVVVALNDAGVDERDVVAIVNTHLHFDHCGQNALFPSASVYVQAAEVKAAREPMYTVPEWADVDSPRVRSLDGDAEIAAGVQVLATPGHTPGHQSVLVGDELVVGQCCYTCAEFSSGAPHPADMHGESWFASGQASLDRLRSLGVASAHFSHDATVWAPDLSS